MSMNRPAHWFRIMDRVRHIDGRCGHVFQADLHHVTVGFDAVGALPPEVEVFPQLTTLLHPLSDQGRDTWEGHDEWGSVADANERLSDLRSRIDDLEWEIDDLVSQKLGLADEADRLENALGLYKKNKAAVDAAIARTQMEVMRHV